MSHTRNHEYTLPTARKDYPQGVIVAVYIDGYLSLTDATGPVSQAEADAVEASYRERFQTASLINCEENEDPRFTGEGVKYTKTDRLYTFEASRFYGPDDRYSSGSGLASSGLSLEDAVRFVDTYQVTPGETYALSVVRGDTVVYSKGAGRNDAHRSMMRAYKRRQLTGSPTTEPGNERRMLKIFRALTVDQQVQLFASIAADETLPSAARHIAADY